MSQFGTPDDCYFFSDSRRVAATYSKLENPASAQEAKLSAPVAPSSRDSLFPAIYTCFLNIRHPYETDFEGNFWDGRDVDGESGNGDVPTTNTIALKAREQGHDGAVIRNVIDMGDDAPYELSSTVYTVFRPEQIKSATQNNGAFDPANPDITFSLAPDASPTNISNPPSSPANRPSTAPLAALHSLSAERLLAADKLGGLPLPSIAVTRLDKPYTWDGEENIYLVGSPSLADPAQGVEIHDRDMWSGHFPELRWIPRARRQREEFYEQARQASLRYYAEGNISPLRFLKNALDGDHRGELESKLRKNDLSLAVFALEQGYTPRPIMTKTLGRLHTGDRLFYTEILKMLEKDADTLHPDKQPDFCAAMQRAIERYRKQYPREEALTVTQARIRKTNLRNMETELEKAQGDGFLDISWQALQDARYAGRPIPDWSANFKRFEKYAARHPKAHDAWVRDKLERWLNPVPRIKGTALKATLENLVQYMLESKRAGAERAVVFSTGLLRAKQSRRFHSLEEVKAARDTLVTTEENHASEQKAQDYIHRFQAALNEIDESFAAYDNAVEALSLVRGQPTRAKITAALTRIYRGTSFRTRIAHNRRLPDLGVMALVSLREELRDYFEGVPQRAVLLSEFSHAVLPASLRRDKTVRDILRRHNIRPLFHDGTQQGRFRALSSLIGTSVSFSLHPGGSPQMSPIVPRPSSFVQPEMPSFSVIGPRAVTWEQYRHKTFPGRDDGLPRAEMDASRSALRDHAAPFRQALRRELAALRRSLPAETKAQIRQYLLLHRKFYQNKKTLEPEKHVPLWHEYLALSGEKETWTALLAPSLLRAGLCGGSLPFARQLSASSLSLLVREDRAVIASLADRGLAETALPLADRLDYPELFAAYPRLRSVPVVTEWLDGFRGFYSPAERIIYLHRSMDDPQEIRSVLLHEVQHAIQHIEGFARGGTAEAARQFYESQRRAAAQALAEGRRFMDWLSARERMIAALKYMLSLARAPRRVLRTSYRYSYSDVSRRLTGEERILDMARYALIDLSRLLEEFYDCNWSAAPEYELPWPYHYNLLTPSGITKCLEDARKTPSRRQAFRRTPKPDLLALNRTWLKYERLSSLTSHELYLRLAGEIEARNVQTRLDWPQSRRAAEPFNTTLDYPGEALAAFRSSLPETRPAGAGLASFSVIGPHAATWDQYAGRAFTGRDDGKLRAEIDASEATLDSKRLLTRSPEALDGLVRRLRRRRFVKKVLASPSARVLRQAYLDNDEYAAGRITGKELWQRFRDTLHQHGYTSEALLPSGEGFAAAFDRITSPVELAINELWQILARDPITEQEVRRVQGSREASLAARRHLQAFMADGNASHIRTLFPASGPFMTHRLHEILDYPELFAAYPSLRDMTVEIQDELPDEAQGIFRADTILLSRKVMDDSPRAILSILLHEIQHAIQEREGYALGGNPAYAQYLFHRPLQERMAAFQDYTASLFRLRHGLKSALDMIREPEKQVESSYAAFHARLQGRELSADERRQTAAAFLEHYLNKARRSLPDDLPAILPPALRVPASEFPIPTPQEAIQDNGAALKDMISRLAQWELLAEEQERELEEETRKQAERYRRIGGDFGAYRRLAGEIEARNVQLRMRWMDTLRREAPFNTTLDYPGEALVAFYPDANTPKRPSSILPRTSESFSLTSLHDIVSSLAAPSMQATRAADLVKDFGKAVENWRRVMSGKEEQPAAPVGAELYGMVSSLISSARLVLPPGYRSRVDLQMQWASVYAAMAESGQIPPKGSLRSGDAFYERFVTAMVNNTLAAATAEDARQILASIGSRRLDRVMSSVLDRVRTQLVYFAKDELYEKTMRRVEAVYPKKEPGKKSPRGRLEAEAYRLLARYRSMLGSTPEVKAEAMASLNALYNGEPDADKRREYEEDLLAWKTYGDYAGMSLPQAQAAMKQLLEFVMTGRSAWTAKLRQERGRAKYAARQIGRNLPAANNASSRANSKIAYRTRLKKCLASLPYGFMSYSHLMLALEPVLGQRFSRERIREIAEANAALLNASNDRAAWLSAAIRRVTGAKSESAAEQWLVEFNTPQETGIILKPAITVQITLPIEEARDWLSLTKEERAARRKEIRKNDAIAETLTENVPEEEDIPLLRQALDDYESRTPDQQQYQRFLTTEREIEGEENAFPLTCSRDCALYAILLHEQEDYADKYDEDGKLIRKGFLRREGFDEAAMAALYEFVGPEGLAYGYALREKLNETGQTLARVYEERMGVPFALKENYFRATFDRNSTREKDTLAEPQGSAIASCKYGSLIERVPHAENLDFSRAASLVFLAAAAEQDNYIHTSHITASWRALLLDKRLEQKLRQNLGEDLMGKLASWLDLIDGASLENNRAFLHLSRMQGMLQRAFAFSVLAGNGYVLLKQSTAILHGFFAGWAPSGVLERADGSHELAHRHISFSSFLFHLAASNMGLGEISLKEVAQTPFFTARMRGEGAILAQIASQMPGQRYSRLEKPAEKLMNLIEAVDVKANLHAMHALANAYYARALRLNRENGSPFTEAQLRAAALEQVGLSLELGAQPLTKTQKSMNQAAGGILSRLAFVMKSEQLNKLGLMAAQWKTGSARNRVCAVQSWLSLGVASSLLAWFIAWLKGQEDDEDEEKKWRKYGATALLGDLTSIPLAGEGVNYLASLFTGQRVFADNYARTLIDVGAITRSLKKEYEHLAQKKEMDWDAHFNNLTALVRAAGVGGAFSRSPSAVLSGYGALSLSAASGANLTRTSKDLLAALFAPPKRKRNKKREKRSR